MAEMGEGAAVTTIPDEPKEPEGPKKEEITLRISVFFDGTGNNRGNIQQRHGNTAIYKLVKKQKPGQPARGQNPSTVGTAVASFESDFSNVALMEEQFEATSECKYYRSIYVEGAGTQDLRQASREYEQEMRVYKEQMQIYQESLKYAMTAPLYPPRKPKFKVDSLRGNVTGGGSTGVDEKKQSAFNQIIDWYSKLVKNEKLDREKHLISKVVIDVFGFSRGAATARSFIHQVLSGTRVIVTKVSTRRGTRYQRKVIPTSRLLMAMEAPGIEIAQDALQIGFAGLFDTVSSHGSALHSDVKDLNLDAVKKARKVYHLTAAEEHRLCFSLTDITSAKNACVGEEYFLPGVHSDIGGGYREEGAQIEDLTIMDHDSWAMMALNFSSLNVSLRQYADLLEKEGWFINRVKNPATLDGRTTQLMVNKVTKVAGGLYGFGATTYEVDTSITAFRNTVKNTYHRIPLNLMAEEAERNDFTFKPRLKSANAVPGELSQVDSAIRSYIGRVGNNSKASDWFAKGSGNIGRQFNFEKLRNEHLHYSSYISTGMWPRFKSGKRYRQQYKG